MADTYTYYGTAGTSASGFTKIFNWRFNYLQINFLATSDTLYVSTDGVTVPTAGAGDGVFVINNGQIITVPNQLPLWYPSSAVIPKGTLLGTGPNTGTPYEINPSGSSLWGQTANPGTVINFITTTGTHNFEVVGIG